MKKDVVNNKLTQYFSQALFILLGACIGLGTSRVTQSCQHSNERKELVNHIKGSLINEIADIGQLINILQQSLKDPGTKLSSNSFRWQHGATFLHAVSTRAGSLEMEVVVKLSKYFDMVEQSRAFRDVVRETLFSNSGDIRKSTLELQAYIQALMNQKKIGEELLKEIEKTYG